MSKETISGRRAQGETFEVCVELGVPYPWHGSEDE
jgi:hypothetical protein